MKKIFIIVTILISFYTCQAQYLAAFNDNLKQFWAFEAGMFNQLEEEEILEFQVGGILIAYLDHASNFKVYQYGEVKTLLEVAQVEFTTTDYLLGYSLIDTLYVYDGEQVKTLSTDCEDYIVMDSIIVWKTKKTENLNVYYNGVVSTIAEGLYDFKIESHMAGDNLFAFVNTATKEFMMFYLGELQVIDDYADEMSYQAGCDILAFTDKFDQTFNVFYEGEVIELDLYGPKSFQVGDQILAFVDDLENLKFFENGQVKTISSDQEFYEVRDHIMVYGEQGSFKTICNGQVYIIEQYIPQPYYLDVNTIAYLEHNESIRVFQHCESVTTNRVDVVAFTMVRDVIVYAENEEEIKVYFNGEVYEHQPN